MRMGRNICIAATQLVLVMQHHPLTDLEQAIAWSELAEALEIAQIVEFCPVHHMLHLTKAGAAVLGIEVADEADEEALRAERIEDLLNKEPPPPENESFEAMIKRMKEKNRED